MYKIMVQIDERLPCYFAEPNWTYGIAQKSFPSGADHWLDCITQSEDRLEDWGRRRRTIDLACNRHQTIDERRKDDRIRNIGESATALIIYGQMK